MFGNGKEATNREILRHFNFKNIPLTACRTMLLNTGSMFINSSGDVRSDIYSEADEIKVHDSEIVELVVNGISYKLGDMITLYDNGKLAFGVIEKLQSENSQR